MNLRRANSEDITALAQQELTALQEVKAAERSLTIGIMQNNTERRQLKQDRLEKDLDILKDGFDNQKSINERLINDDKLTLSKKIKILNETKKLGDGSFASQIATIQQFTGIALKENELLAASDSRVLNDKIRALGLSEIAEGRLLEVIRDRRTAVQDLAEVEKGLLKINDVKIDVKDIENDVLSDSQDLYEELIALEEEKANEEVRIEEAKQEKLNELRNNALEEEKNREQQIRDFKKDTVANLEALNNLILQLDLKRAGDNEKAQRDAQIKAAKRQKAISILNVGINTAEAVTKALAQTGVLAPFVIPTIIATGAIQAATIAATPIGYNKGGFTGDGNGYVDNTGEKFAGFVHQDEFVASRKLTAHPEYGGVLKRLDGIQKGFNQGGFTNEINIQQPNSNNQYLITYINAVNDRIDRMTVIIDPLKTIQAGASQAEIIESRTI